MQMNITYTASKPSDIVHLDTCTEKNQVHSTISEYLRFLNTRGYKHSIDSKLKTIDVFNCNINDNDPFNIQMNQILSNDYVQQHRERLLILKYFKRKKISSVKLMRTVSKPRFLNTLNKFLN